MKKFVDTSNFIQFIPVLSDVEATKMEHCLCFSCKNKGICKYRSNFIRFQQENFPAKIDCYKYEMGENEK